MKFVIPQSEIEMTAVRSAGAGGQNVNRVATAVHLRFDVARSSLPPWLKQRLLERKDHRISRDGVVVLKSQEHRSQELNREEAVRRLLVMVHDAAVLPKARKATRPTRAAKKRRLEGKRLRGRTKRLRGKAGLED